MSWGFKLYDLLEDLETRTAETLTETKFSDDITTFESNMQSSLDEILTQLKILNLHLATLTNENITEGDTK